jgi:sulfatase modifying factor 1
MDDFLGGCIGIIVVAAIVVAVIGVILQVLYFGVLFITANIVAGADKLLSAIPFLPPALSWAVIGAAVGALLYFAVREAPRLNRPAASGLAMTMAALIVMAAMFMHVAANESRTAVIGDGFTSGKSPSVARTVQPSNNSSRQAPVKATTASQPPPATRPATVSTGELENTQLLPAGSFTMGSQQTPESIATDYGGTAKWYEDERPAHRVEFPKPFHMQKYEVTNREFESFVKETHYQTDAERENWAYGFRDGEWRRLNGVTWRAPLAAPVPTAPVVCVTISDARAYAKWLSKKTGKQYRLPTEAEWEYACRAGSNTAFPWGNDAQSAKEHGNIADTAVGVYYTDWKVAQWNDGCTYTCPVGSYRPNAWGLYDMIGNAWEWCSDNYGPYPGAPSGVATLPSLHNVFRGGSWASSPWLCRASARFHRESGYRSTMVGFRLVREASSGENATFQSPQASSVPEEPAVATAPQPATSVKEATITADSLNVREGPGKETAAIAKLPNATRVTILQGPQEVEGVAWYKIQSAGATGWVSGAYLNFEAAGATSTAPSATTATESIWDRDWDGAGTWSGSEEGYAYAVQIELPPSGSPKIDGKITWILKKSPRSSEQSKIGKTATEHVRGVFDATTARLTLEGYKDDDPHGIIDLDKYDLRFSSDFSSLSGSTHDHGDWKGVLSATAGAKATAPAAADSDGPASVTWPGDWGGEFSSQGKKLKFALSISQENGPRIVASGSADDWPGVEQYEGKIDGEKLVLTGKSIVPPPPKGQDFSLDTITLTASADGNTLSGTWRDTSGASGSVRVNRGVRPKVDAPAASQTTSQTTYRQAPIVSNTPRVVNQNKDFIEYDNGVIRDVRGKLEWLVGPEGVNYEEAEKWASSIRVDLLHWRIPNYEEMKRIWDRREKHMKDPFFRKTRCDYFWLSDVPEESLYSHCVFDPMYGTKVGARAKGKGMLLKRGVIAVRDAPSEKKQTR